MLTRLLTIKRQRERKAIASHGEAQREFDRLHAASQAKEQELLDYGNWRKLEAARLYEAVHQQKLSYTKLEGYRQQIGFQRSRELKLEDELAEAKHALEAAGQDLEASRQRELEARREVIRFEEYVSRLNRLEKLQVERGEETETEETVAARFTVKRAENN